MSEMRLFNWIALLYLAIVTVFQVHYLEFRSLKRLYIFSSGYPAEHPEQR